MKFRVDRIVITQHEETIVNNKHNFSETARETFDGLPVVDAEHELSLIVNSKDVSAAKRKDFGNCVFANTCRRQLGSTTVAIMRQFAYVSHPDANGQTVVYRYQLSNKMRQIIASFDRGEPIEACCMFLLKPPAPSNSLEAHRLSDKKCLARRTAYLRGELSQVEAKAYERRSEVQKKGVATRRNKSKYSGLSNSDALDVRNGTGMISMQRAKARLGSNV